MLRNGRERVFRLNQEALRYLEAVQLSKTARQTLPNWSSPQRGCYEQYLDELDKRIAKTQTKKPNLLLVLKYPELSLHNNRAELGGRQRVRKRDVSFGPRTLDGTRAWDTFMTLAATTKKLDVSFYQYIHDRICQTNQIPPLAHLVEQAAQELNLGWSWSSA